MDIHDVSLLNRLNRLNRLSQWGPTHPRATRAEGTRAATRSDRLETDERAAALHRATTCPVANQGAHGADHLNVLTSERGWTLGMNVQPLYPAIRGATGRR